MNTWNEEDLERLEKKIDYLILLMEKGHTGHTGHTQEAQDQGNEKGDWVRVLPKFLRDL